MSVLGQVSSELGSLFLYPQTLKMQVIQQNVTLGWYSKSR